MKKVLILLLIAGGLFIQKSSAQVRINVNIGSQPLWGPVGYDYAEYYYLPEYDMYYSVPDRRYVYWDNRRWVFAATPPPRYRNVNLYSTHKVVLNSPKPYLQHNEHVRMYAQYRGRHDQAVIRNSHDQKYWAIKDHPDHNKWHGNDRNDRRDRHDDHRHH